MKGNYIFIGSPGINDLVKNFPSEEDNIRFPNISAGYAGSLLEKYFSFSGFYKIKNLEKNTMLLKKINMNKKVPENYSVFNLEFSHISALQSFANDGVSCIKGELNSKNLEGTIQKIDFNTYQVHINNEE